MELLSLPYEIDHTCYRQVFILPKVLVEKHLKLSGALQLKVLLWVFYHQGILDGLEEISNDLGASPGDIQDALQYWIAHGLLKPTDEAPPKKEETVLSKVNPPSQVPKVSKSRLQRPSHFEVARRMNESPELAYLVCEAQGKFGRVLTDNELSTLTFIMDTYGLSPAVILMVIEHACAIEKCNIRYIKSTAVAWAEQEIDTVQKAEEYLTRLEQYRLDWNVVSRTFGIDKRKPSKQEQIYINRWLQEWKFSVTMLKEAYDQCVNNAGKISFNYINKVLENWYHAGYKKPEDIQSDAAKTNGSRLKKTSAIKSSSIDIDELDELL